MTADGAYDGEAVYDTTAERHPEAAVIIPPRATAVSNESAATQRDRHIAEIEEHGRKGWQRRSGYNRRSLVETAMYRCKTVVSRRSHARILPNQRTEVKIGCNVLNRMTTLGMPATVRISRYPRPEARRNQRSIHPPRRLLGKLRAPWKSKSKLSAPNSARSEPAIICPFVAVKMFSTLVVQLVIFVAR
jgi:hypothetical protein